MPDQLAPKGDELLRYFRAKREQLLTTAKLPICAHEGLAGSHREELQRVYLREILPSRFDVGRGMIYGQYHRSREVDLVIWDAQNYPSLPMADHAFYFVDSVKVALESKTTYSVPALRDALAKSKSVRDIVPPPGHNLDDLLAKLQLEIECLKQGTTHSGLWLSKHHVATASIFLNGGNIKSVLAHARRRILELDEVWPDVMVMLEPGILVAKVPGTEIEGTLLFFEAGEDALLVFTSIFLDLLRDRTVIVESPHFTLKYVPGFRLMASEVMQYRRVRFGGERVPLRPDRL